MFTFRAGLALLVGLSGSGMVSVLAQASAEEAPPVAAEQAVDAAARSPYHDLLVRAIEERLLIQFTYGGHVRVCEPHAYGVGSEGTAILHTFQTAGSSGSKPPPGWRTFTVSGITDMVLTRRRFARVRAGFNEERPRLDPAWAEIAPAEEPVAAASAAE